MQLDIIRDRSLKNIRDEGYLCVKIFYVSLSEKCWFIKVIIQIFFVDIKFLYKINIEFGQCLYIQRKNIRRGIIIFLF